MEFIKHNAADNYSSKLWWMWITVCMSVWLLCLQYSGACNQTCSGSFHSAINGGVCGPGGKQMDLIGWGGGEALKHVRGVFTARSRVCVSSYRGSLPLVVQYLFISLTHCSEGYTVWRQGEEEGEDGCGSGERERACEKRHEMRSEQAECGHGIFLNLISEVWDVCEGISESIRKEKGEMWRTCLCFEARNNNFNCCLREKAS